ncbi:MAG: flavodoxin domain-containing protein [Methanomassiliicoccus sp.]|nr:flavodoxin domain-containing protein [Methanomassiliicoccus sp.]
MKALVAFGTRYGTTARIAEIIGEELTKGGYEVDVLDLRDGAGGGVDGYDLVVLGSSVFVGKWTKEAQRFLESSAPALTERKVALFVSCSDVLFPEKVEAGRKMYLDDVAAGVPGLSPVAKGMFGGVIDFGRYNTLTKALLAGVGTKKRLRGKGIDPSQPYDFREWQEVRAWARALCP